MVLVLANEVDADYRYFVDALAGLLGDAEVYDYPTRGGRPDLDGVDAVVVSGSTAGVYERDDRAWIDDEAALVREAVERRIPTLGVCFGHQLVNDALGGAVEHRGLTAELVRADLAADPLFDGVAPVVPAVHGDHVVEPGDGMEPIAAADYYPHLGTRHRDRPVWTVQYHPEFTDALLPRVADDFGFAEDDHSFADVTARRTLDNFVRLADEYRDDD